jgi:YidC/Oxa1 family membrane protein insertase
MLGTIWNTLLVNPIFNILVGLYKLTGSLGFSIIILTVFIRTLLIPAVMPSMKAMKKQRDLQPELDEIKQKYKQDKKKQAEMQMVLFKKHGLNPASGCLTQVVMIIVLIALYGVIRMFTINPNIVALNARIYFDFIKLAADEVIKTQFLWMNLAKPDPIFVLAILSGLLQLVQSKMTMPFVEAGEKAAAKTSDKKDDIAYNMQQQMLYTMPIMNVIIGVTLPAGVVLYILATTIFSVVQTYFVSGWGGMKSWLHKLGYRNLK